MTPPRCRSRASAAATARRVSGLRVSRRSAISSRRASRPYVEGTEPTSAFKIAASTVNRSSIRYLKASDPVCPRYPGSAGMPAIRWSKSPPKEPPARTRTLSLAEEAQIMEHLREGYGSAFLFAVKSSLRLRDSPENSLGIKSTLKDARSLSSRRVTTFIPCQ